MHKTPTIPVKLTDVREMDEYNAEAAKIRDVYLNRHDKGAPLNPGNVGPYMSLRERILSVSLFPNIYSSKRVLAMSQQ
jgi:hypothetical protein